VLSAIGLMMIYSATRSSGTFSMERQMIFVAAGLIMLLIFSNIDYREYRVMLPIISIVTLVLLGAVFLFDPVSDGGVGQAYRWIPLGFFNLQPSEFAKVVVILVLASLLAPERNSDEPPSRQLSWKKLAMALLVVGVPGVLIYEQPDLGTAPGFGFGLYVLDVPTGVYQRPSPRAQQRRAAQPPTVVEEAGDGPPGGRCARRPDLRAARPGHRPRLRLRAHRAGVRSRGHLAADADAHRSGGGRGGGRVPTGAAQQLSALPHPVSVRPVQRRDRGLLSADPVDAGHRLGPAAGQ